MSLIALFKAALYAYVITVLQRIASGISSAEAEIDALGIDATAHDLLRLERLGKRVKRDSQLLRSLRSLLGHD
jgi:hypothetical protein